MVEIEISDLYMSLLAVNMYKHISTQPNEIININGIVNNILTPLILS
ncbi:MAG: hypothetical protein ACI4S3_09510 [Candidatus Gastranaerophilaceae bacterium]